ncbi:SbcC/MukB-like Walker B domain-containing protein [Coraliomargarita sp. SDUM461004]|uniref:SbcC/MukB-like Walker B domain-containing protein n=1 Tax=Thalassobacterium sedimentorum TaxID=3041258 RepID=A0ABU1AGZ4_9BACT|nr:SbcC/MukB-like Walker B domain-containing protein [Coraliomargarita sp. SDUM461004]MDQ8194009.1 SbcC/MukB-like Walker B domain-containing protein [Coraliomargarita sp. SDUM461004]
MNHEPQATLEFAPDRSTAGFRLHQFSVLNWGTFHGRVHSFAPDGRTSLLSGGNGAGKSTLADAVLTILIDSRKRNYNQASAGGGERKQKKERNEKDYVLGTYSEEHDQERGYGRPKQLRKAGQSVTVLLAYFYNETYQQHVTLAQVLWLTPAKKLERAYVVAKKKLTIEDDFKDLGSPSEVRQKLKERALEPLDTFTLYSQRFHEALCLSAEKNPMDIFNQAVCIKDISNLTNFIREYMLDDGGAPKKLEELRNNFEELRRTYERIEREKKRLDRLNEIHRLNNTVQIQEDQVDHWTACIEAAPLFFAETELKFRTADAEEIERELVKARAEETSEGLKVEAQQERIQQLTIAIESSETGRRLQQIKAELAQLQQQIKPRQARYKQFIARAEKWRTGTVCQAEADFIELLAEAQKDAERLGKRSKALGRQLDQLRAELEQLTLQQEQISAEVRSLQEREGNIDDKLTRMRDGIAKALKVRPKELPFVGELVQVKESEAIWTGAIERLVHSFALCVLVPGRLRKQMDDYVHRTNLRGLLVYHVVEGEARSTNPQLHAEAVAAKLEIHADAGEFDRWLAAELSYRYDHLCCEAPDELFNRAKTAITVGGLIKQRGSERRKDDRHDINDRSRDVLGWDNSTKIKALQTRHAEQEVTRSELVENVRKLTNEKDGIDTALQAAKSLPDIASDWDAVDYFSPALAQDELKVERQRLESSSDEQSSLQAQLEEAKAAKARASENSKNARERLGAWKARQEQNESGMQDCQTIIDLANENPEQMQVMQERLPAVKKLLEIPPTSVAALQTAKSQISSELDRKRSEANRKRNDAGNAAKLEIQRFLDDVKNEEPKLHDELYTDGLAVPGYSESLFAPFEKLRIRIEEEDLPKNQQRFNRLLQTNLIEDVSSFDGLLSQHAETIKNRIADLNLHLKEVDFDRNKHTYIQLVPERTDDDKQKRFRALRQYALENIVQEENTDEERSERFNRVRHLLDELSKDEKWTQQVVDVRNWFNFRADEFYRETDESFQCYSGASGKSGGEKNRLASTILATAIAYQYGISLNNDHQTETFRLVVVDEMFSKTDDEFSTYLLELFKQFSLQLIIVQPLDSKVHLVQKYVERYHIVTRPNVHSEIHNLDVYEYKQLMDEVADS